MKKSKFEVILFIMVTLTSCSNFLDQSSDNIFTNDQVFSDINMVNSVLANFYGRVNYGPSLDDYGGFAYTDEASNSSGGINYFHTFSDNWWRVYDYGLIRDINQFITGVKSVKNDALTDNDRKRIEGEARFLRAYVYFNMAKCLGGVPIVYDKIFSYDKNTEVSNLQIPRSSEAATYDYIISECDTVAHQLLVNSTYNDYTKNIHAARANKWVALALKARAALYAGSIAKYNQLVTPDIQTKGGEVGIPSELALKYYQIAYNTAKEIIDDGPYSLYEKDRTDLGRNFYDLFVTKDNNPEVMWAKDYIYPGQTQQFTNQCIAASVKGDVDCNAVTPILNLVDAFEYKNNPDGHLTIEDENGNPVYYKNVEDIFNNKDARLFGTIITPGSTFRGIKINYQAGQVVKDASGNWIFKSGSLGSTDVDGNVLTDINGPISSNDLYGNKTGFNIRKFMDENKDAATRGRGSDIWFVRFRYAEVLLIETEAALELNKPQSEICSFINQLRERAGIQDLKQCTLDNIINENRVEFAFENHRYWDLKRWRKAHLLWNDDDNNESDRYYSLFPYKINSPGDPHDGEWIFKKVKTFTRAFPLYSQLRNYYNFIDQSWINNNPKLVKNPYQ